MAEKTQKKKTSLQLQALESFYEEEKYPSRTAMECHATVFGLTYKQVRGWFVERRRREKRKRTAGELLSGGNGVGVASGRVAKRRESTAAGFVGKRKAVKARIQRLQTADYLTRKVFRKDGPPLGVEFDGLPSRALWNPTDNQNDLPTCKEKQMAPKRGTITTSSVTSNEELNSSGPRKIYGAGKGTMRKHGAGKDLTSVRRPNGGEDLMKQHGCGKESMTMRKYGGGKGLMTVWRATNPDADARDFLVDMGLANGQVTRVPRKPQTQRRRLQQKKSVPKQGRLQSKLQEKRKRFVKRREVECNEVSKQKLPTKEKCELSLEVFGCEDLSDKIAMLADDEELELRELQARPLSVGCLNHLSTNGVHGCPLCKDLLVKFPPSSVLMKQPFHMQPWDLSPEMAKKLFKVFHFLYTYAIMLDLSSFTLDEFAQAFNEKDSLLLGEVHVALLKLLISHVRSELSSGSKPYSSKSCNFLAFIHWVEDQEPTMEFWERSLNPLTWTEILRQVLVAAGFGSKKGAMRKGVLSKEMSLMLKHGLNSGTLKGELFKLLLEHGINGVKVSELAKSLQTAELNVSSRIEDLESLISSTLSSDITLFEKISSSTYRARINSSEDEVEEFRSDSEDSGAVDDDLSDNDLCSSDDDSGCYSGNLNSKKSTHITPYRSKTNMQKVHTEIDESHPGEVWLLGLMEGEYSDLSTEEKLKAIVALIDLLHAGSNLRLEDPANGIAECRVPNSLHSGSGAKIKRSSAKQQSVPRSSWVHVGNVDGVNEAHTHSLFHPVDSSASLSKIYGEGYSTKEKDCCSDSHVMQSVFLGSDRRHNRYWLFLGPCNVYDPGHRRVYFESSEDGHWEVIDTKEGLCALLSVLDDRGKREAFLIESLEKRLTFLCEAMSNTTIISDASENFVLSDRFEPDNSRENSYSPMSDVDNNSSETACNATPLNGTAAPQHRKKGEDLRQKWKRIQAFDSWLWNSFYLDLNSVKHGKRSFFDTLTRCESCHDLYWRDEKHCRVCHTTFELHFDMEEMFAIHVATCREKETTTFPEHRVLASQIQSLKAAIHAIESVMPEDALLGAWRKSAHKLWVKRLRRTSSLSELLQVLTDFVGAINVDWLYKCKILQGSCKLGDDIISTFASMPRTTSAVALWLVELDDLIAPHIKGSSSERRPGTRTRGKHPKQ